MDLDGAITAALVQAATEVDDDLDSSGDEDGDAEPSTSRGTPPALQACFSSQPLQF
jgi:hypothetical protein